MPLRETTPARRPAVVAGALPALLFTFMSLLPTAASAATSLDMMPAPAVFRIADGRLPVTASFAAGFRGADDPRVRDAVVRLLRRWEDRTGITFPRTADGARAFAADPGQAALLVECGAATAALPAPDEDESYALAITPARAELRAATSVGALRGLATLEQLLQADAGGPFLPAVSIEDRPRFRWRGLMIDVCRHWQPLSVIERNLDGMALVKLNVLHLHLSDDQGFRVESKTHPELQRLASDGHYFTHSEIRRIVAAAAERGIRVVPEFDVPGHATSWCVAHPELASAPGPYVLERRWGVFNPVLDPTNEQTYALLDDVFGEMAALFPDPYFHIGGDENNGVQWNANPRIQAFIREHQLKDNAGLHAYFNRRVHALLTRRGKRMAGWDEILHPNLPRDSLVQSWRGPKGLADAATRGFATILSNGYYIDYCQTAAQLYANDPLPANTPLSVEQQQHVLGGEATMWAEWVSPETIDSRIWPRTAAIAERLWSPRDVNDVGDMYRRLAIVSRRLEETGLNHDRNRPAMIRRLAGDAANPAELANLATLVDAIEPVKEYRRGAQQPDATQFTPLTGLADCARPESDVARRFGDAVDVFLRSPRAAPARRDADGATVTAQLREWQAAGVAATGLLSSRSMAGRDGATVARALAEASAAGLEAIEALRRGEPKDAAWRATELANVDRAAGVHGAVELPMLPAIRRLIEQAASGRPVAG